jgi:hypothetical protein
MIRVVHTVAEFFITIPDPGVKKAPDPGSATLFTSPVKQKPNPLAVLRVL